MNNKTILFLIGISGSGKSTWATNLVKTQNYIRTNRDDIRKTIVGNLEGYYKSKRIKILEEIVTSISTNIENIVFLNNMPLVVDNTNLKIEYLNSLITRAKNNGYEVKFKLFDCELDKAKSRIAVRDCLFYEELEYIEKQFKQYGTIKKYILKHYESQIIQ